MILDRKTYKDIEMHFKAYLADKEYVDLKSREIAENITSVPGGSSRRGRGVPDPTARKAIRIETELKPITDWIEVIEATEKYFDDQAKKDGIDLKYGKGELIRRVYYKNEIKYVVMIDIGLTEGSYWKWRNDILNRAALFASAKGLIE